MSGESRLATQYIRHMCQPEYLWVHSCYKLNKFRHPSACLLFVKLLIFSVDEQSVLKRLSALTLNGPSDGNACSCCGIGPFESRQEQIAHYKNHWHTHNLKRKLFGKTSLTFGQFNSRIGKYCIDGVKQEMRGGIVFNALSWYLVLSTWWSDCF